MPRYGSDLNEKLLVKNVSIDLEVPDGMVRQLDNTVNSVKNATL
jgi:hypothetical protein